jgi:hypothetical protein
MSNRVRSLRAFVLVQPFEAKARLNNMLRIQPVPQRELHHYRD